MAKQTFFQKIGLASQKVKNSQWLKPIEPSSLIGKTKKNDFKYTKREKKITVANLEGAGLGFVIGTSLGGFGGMALGVPLGTIAGNIAGRKIAGKQVGRPMKYRQKQNFLGKLLSTRAERVEYDKKMMKQARKK